MVLSFDEVTNACIDLVTIEGRLFTLLNSTPFRALVEPIFSGETIHLLHLYFSLSEFCCLIEISRFRNERYQFT